MLTKADDIIRFLDTGFNVMLFKNKLGTYSAALLVKMDDEGLEDSLLIDCEEQYITDADTPTKALFELSQKILREQAKK